MYWSSKSVSHNNQSVDKFFGERFAFTKTSSNLIKPNFKAAGPSLIFSENSNLECKERLGHWQPFRSIFFSSRASANRKEGLDLKFGLASAGRYPKNC